MTYFERLSGVSAEKDERRNNYAIPQTLTKEEPLSKACPARLCGDRNLSLIRDEVLPEIFRDTAARLPDKVAMRFGAQTLTFADIDTAAERVAAALTVKDSGPGASVGIFIERSPMILVAALGVMKTGAAFLPIDPGAPVDRIVTCLGDCGAVALVVDAVREQHTVGVSVPRLRIDALTTGSSPPEPIDFRARGLTRDHACYLIYTSGSTGKPKGIAVAHRNICHFARSENEVLGVREDDVVWHGFSPAFDMSLEEVWTAWLVGATLVMATPEEATALDRLPETLSYHGITALHAVPSLVATFDRDVPTLRLLNLGGEPCPPAVIERWWRQDRRIVNTYGPTETTVSATAAELSPDVPVTIGHPLPNYTAYVLDEKLSPVALGEPGELCIGGPGVSLGYVGRDELTTEKFVQNPYLNGETGDPILYRTGDLVSLDEESRIVFHSRIDDQVKVRGYRIELGEIEAELSRLPELKGAAVTVREDAAGTDQLVAFVVLREGAKLDSHMIRTSLTAKVPAYMVPSLFRQIEELPRLASGKLNRKALPDVTDFASESDETESVAPRTLTECRLVDAWEVLFPGRRVSVTADFFTDLGGHSLIVATYVSQLRKEDAFRTVSLQDVYATRNIAALAARIDATAVVAPKPEKTQAFLAVPWMRYFACGAAQAMALLAKGALATGTLFAVLYFYWFVLVSPQVSNPVIAVGLVSVTAILVLPLLAILFSVAVKWLVIGRYKPGAYPLWGGYYWRCWLVGQFTIPMGSLSGTPLYNFYLRLLGAKIGRGCHLGSLSCGAIDLVSIGKHTSLGKNVMLNTTVVEDGQMKIGRISIGEHAFVGASSVLNRDTSVGDWAELNDLTLLAEGSAVPAAEVWSGSPARFKAKADLEAAGTPEYVSSGTLIGTVAMFAVLVFLLFPLCALLPSLPALAFLLTFLSECISGISWPALGLSIPSPAIGLSSYFALAPALSLLSTVLIALEIVALRWLFQGRIREGVFRVASGFYVRKWAVDRLIDASLFALHSIYASLYLPPWYRALGVKIGQRTEVSNASAITPDLLEIGDESFVADHVTLGDSHVRHGRLTLKQTRVGVRSFLGNGALIPDGTRTSDGVLIGCLSTPPQQGTEMPTGTTWFGIPGSLLPARQTFTGYPEHLTFRPTPSRIAGRLAVELFRVVFPGVVTISSMMLIVMVAVTIFHSYGILAVAALLPLLYLCIMGLPALLVTALLKWLVIGRYRPDIKPMWTPFVWLSEAVTTIYETLAVPLFLSHLQGTPFLAPCLRLLGVKIGRRVFLNTTDMTEFDMISIGDHAALNDNCGPQTHLFEDRVMKIGPVEIGPRAVVGARSIVLYDTRLEADARLNALSLVMKGETLPENTAWTGSPAEPVLIHHER